MISTKLVSLFVKNRNFWDFLQWEDHPETTLHFRYEKKSPPPKAQEKKILINTYTIRENHNTQFLQWNNTRYLEKCWKKKRMLIIISLSRIEFKIVWLSLHWTFQSTLFPLTHLHISLSHSYHIRNFIISAFRHIYDAKYYLLFLFEADLK